MSQDITTDGATTTDAAKVVYKSEPIVGYRCSIEFTLETIAVDAKDANRLIATVTKKASKFVQNCTVGFDFSAPIQQHLLLELSGTTYDLTVTLNPQFLKTGGLNQEAVSHALSHILEDANNKISEIGCNNNLKRVLVEHGYATLEEVTQLIENDVPLDIAMAMLTMGMPIEIIISMEQEASATDKGSLIPLSELLDKGSLFGGSPFNTDGFIVSPQGTTDNRSPFRMFGF